MTAAHAEAGQRFVAAPVFGRPEAAQAAKLFVVAAGEPAPLQAISAAFDAISQRTFVVSDEPKTANLVKLSGNFLITSVIESLGEAMALVGKAGVDKHQYLDILTSTLFGAPIYKTYGALIAGEQFEPAGFAASLGQKDIRLVLAAAEELQVPMPVASLMRDRFLTLLARGGADLDWSAIGALAAWEAGAADPTGALARYDAAQPVGAEDRLEHRRVVRASPQHQAAVDVDDLARDIAGRIAEQEQRSVGDVGDLARPRATACRRRSRRSAPANPAPAQRVRSG